MDTGPSGYSVTSTIQVDCHPSVRSSSRDSLLEKKNSSVQWPSMQSNGSIQFGFSSKTGAENLNFLITNILQTLLMLIKAQRSSCYEDGSGTGTPQGSKISPAMIRLMVFHFDIIYCIICRSAYSGSRAGVLVFAQKISFFCNSTTEHICQAMPTTIAGRQIGRTGGSSLTNHFEW